MKLITAILLFGSALCGADNTVHYIISSGQSLSIGTGGSPCYSMFQPPLGASVWVSHAQGSWPAFNLKMNGTNSVVDFTQCRPAAFSTNSGTISIDTAGNVVGAGTAFLPTHNTGILVAAGVERVFTYISEKLGKVSPSPTVAVPAGTTFWLSTNSGSFQSFETHHMGMVNTLTELHPTKDYVSMTVPDGVGGTSYNGLKLGTIPYTASIMRLSNSHAYVTATDAATGRPRPFVVSALDIIHGESDFGRAASAYVSDLREWRNTYIASSKAITGQSNVFPMFTDQYSSWGRLQATPTVWRLKSDPTLPGSSYPPGTMIFNTTSRQYKVNIGNLWTVDTTTCAAYMEGWCPSTPLAQWHAARDYPNEIYLVGPKYQYRYSDGLHLTNASYRLLGEMHGKVIARVLHEKQPWIPLAPRRLTRSGAIITARFHIPVGCLQFDTSRNDAAIQQFPKTNQGFEYYDSTDSARILSVVIASCDSVSITLTSIPTGSDKRLRYAYTSTLGALGGTSAASRGTLADTDPALGLDGLSLRDYAIAFDEPSDTYVWEPYQSRYVCNSLSNDMCRDKIYAYTTIQAAVDAAAPGDTIVLESGQTFSCEGACRRPVSDFNLDGRSDVIFQDQNTGWAQVWFLGGSQGTTIVDTENLTLQNSWRIAAVADFDSDGREDLVWQDPVTGAAQIWYLGLGAMGTTLKTAAVLTSSNSARIVAAGDFNGDGTPDLVWQEPTTGQSLIWLLGGTTGTTVLAKLPLSGSNAWNIVGVGDFDGDGHTDVLWQDEVSGWAQIWLLGGNQGTTLLGALNLVQSNTWRIAAVADLNRDTRLDVVWQDRRSGSSQVWFLGGRQGNEVLGAVTLAGPNMWTVAGPR